jgi:hypothetical protein
VAILIHGAPPIVASAMDRRKHLIHVPCVTWPWASATTLVGRVEHKRATVLASTPAMIGKWHDQRLFVSHPASDR